MTHHGKLSFNSYTPTPPKPRLTDALVTLGIVCSLGLIAVSALLNFRIAYRAAASDLDGLIYGGGAGLCDVMKALLPFMLAAGIRNRDLLAVAAATLAFGLFTGYSITAGIGFAADQKLARVGENAARIDRRNDLEDQLRAGVAQLAALRPVRTEAEILQSINAKLAEPAGKHGTLRTITANCTQPTRYTREACAAVATLQVELEAARAAAALAGRNEDLRAQLATMGDDGTNEVADPQTAMLVGMAAWTDHALSQDDVRVILVVLVSMVFEVGSGLGLYLVTTPWRDPMFRKTIAKDGRAAPSTTVQEFLLGALEPVEGQQLPERVLRTAYEGWCTKHGLKPLNASSFRTGLLILATEYGLPVDLSGQEVVIDGIGLQAGML